MINPRRKNTRRSTSIILIIVCASLLFAQAKKSDCLIPIPSCGKLQLSLPQEWNASINEEKHEEIPTFSISIGKDNEILALVSPLSPCGSGEKYDNIDKMLEEESKMLLPNAVESNVSISKIPSNKNHSIYYFSLTDKAPEPGDFKYLTRIIGLIDNALINITILKHKKDDSRTNTFLSALSKADLVEKDKAVKPIAKSDTLYFTGKDIFLEKDSMAIIGKKENKILTVSNLKINTAIVLPYTEDWQFWSTPNTLLSGNSGGIKFSLIRVIKNDSDIKYLESVKMGLEESKDRHGLVKAEIKEFKGIPILRTYSIPPKMPGVDIDGLAQFSYFGVKRDGKYLYVYHISKIAVTEKENWPGDKAFIKFASIGLQVNIEKNLK